MKNKIHMDEIYYEDEYIIAFPTEVNLCIVRNKRPYDVYLIFNTDEPLENGRILANGVINIVDERYVNWIKEEKFFVMRVVCKG